MESPCADYRIDGWCLPFPREWPLSLDREAQPPQLIFEVAGEPVTVYVSTWNLCRPETGEVPGAETVCALMAQALAQQGARRLEGYQDCLPPDLAACMGRSTTSDGCEMTSCFLCAEGCAISVYFVCGQGVDCGRYLPCLKRVRREEAPPASWPEPMYP